KLSSCPPNITTRTQSFCRITNLGKSRRPPQPCSDSEANGPHSCDRVHVGRPTLAGLAIKSTRTASRDKSRTSLNTPRLVIRHGSGNRHGSKRRLHCGTSPGLLRHHSCQCRI